MKPYYSEPLVSIFHGDSLAVLPTFAPERFATVITDPPYHLTSGKRGGSGVAFLNVNSPAGRSRVTTGFMGKAWDGGDVAFRPETWAAVLRVCKPGAMLLAFGGSRTFHRLACAIEDAGWELRDCMSWLYGSGFPKSLDISKAINKAAGAKGAWRQEDHPGRPGKRAHKSAFNQTNASGVNPDGVRHIYEPETKTAAQWSGWGTALKPAWEPIIVAMKPLAGTFAKNALQYGVAGLNIDGGRIAGAKPATTRGLGDRTADWGMNAQGRILDDGKGRWPANVLLDEQVSTMLDEQGGELTSGANPTRRAAKFKNTFGEFDGQTECNAARGADAGGASRFFYTAKASKSDRGSDNDHPTVKPTELLKYLCTLTATPTGGEILDPFGGSMTTAVAARECGRPSVMIELEEAHCRIGIERLRQQVLFGAGGVA